MTVWTAIVTSQVFAITLRILLSIGLGALIGLERQLRARSAGIRTNALVSLGSCLFTTVGVYTLAAGTGDPTRVAAQVATGSTAISRFTATPRETPRSSLSASNSISLT